MDNNTKTYKATLTLSSGGDMNGGTMIEQSWDPPLSEVFIENPDSMPPAYLLMCAVLEKSIFPAVAMNDRYEAALIEDPSIADVADAAVAFVESEG